MHGLILRALQGYVAATFGPGAWPAVLAHAGLTGERFEPLLSSGPELLRQMLDAASCVLGLPPAALLEDTGTFLAANPANPAIRRLLCLGGATFEEFLHSLEELPDRARLALPEFDFPRLDLDEAGPGEFRLRCHGPTREIVPLVQGALRAMAARYGVQVAIGRSGDGDRMALSLVLAGPRPAGDRRLDLVAAG